MEYPALCLAWISSFCCLVNFANRNTPNNSGVQIIGGTSENDVAFLICALIVGCEKSDQAQDIQEEIDPVEEEIEHHPWHVVFGEIAALHDLDVVKDIAAENEDPAGADRRLENRRLDKDANDRRKDQDQQRAKKDRADIQEIALCAFGVGRQPKEEHEGNGDSAEHKLCADGLCVGHDDRIKADAFQRCENIDKFHRNVAAFALTLAPARKHGDQQHDHADDRHHDRYGWRHKHRADDHTDGHDQQADREFRHDLADNVDATANINDRIVHFIFLLVGNRTK